ncbi:MAG: tripartite tricarboxylate transporter substrate binding protein [Burkholderiales bacterium]|nr:tripartite tricarboxylate transporter substrate binding protein [Burkholderiales bacterium]
MTDPLNTAASAAVVRRRRFVAAGIAGLGGAVLPARAQTRWPDRPVRLVVPFPPGGNSDALGRVVAERMRDLLGHGVVVENRPGGTTQVGTEFVARAEPDGHTMLLAAATSFTVLPNLRKLPYDHESGFEIAAGIADYVAIVTARNGLGVKTLPEFVALARRQPGKLTWGSAGVASAGHLYGEIVKQQTGIDLLHVPFKGSADLIAALGGGQVDLIIDGVGLGMARNGQATALAAFFGRRHPDLPDVPALPETGLRIDLPAGGWGLAFPRGTPRAIVDQVGSLAERIMAEPETRARLLKASVVADWSPAADYRRGLAQARTYYGALIKAAGIRLEG